MDRDELIFRNRLANSEEWKAIRERVLTRAVAMGAQGCKEGLSGGWLELIKYVDTWPSDLDRALKDAKKDKE